MRHHRAKVETIPTDGGLQKAEPVRNMWLESCGQWLESVMYRSARGQPGCAKVVCFDSEVLAPK